VCVCWMERHGERDGDAYMNMLLGAHAVHKLGVFSRVFLVCLHVNIESRELCSDFTAANACFGMRLCNMKLAYTKMKVRKHGAYHDACM
jgi:hypothetical protein